MKNNIEKVSSWLKDYMEDNGFKGFVLGLSGGIDSAVSLGLAIKAVGSENVRCFALPCTHDDEKMRHEDLQDAELVAKTFGVKLEIICLDNEMNKLYNDVLKYTTNSEKLIIANIKARLRMTTLRALAEALGYLVLGTTNKTEEYLGYYTKAGDGGAGVDIEPIADFFKYEVRELAKELGVPDKIITKDPSAGLWYDQTDEDEIGFKYDDIDRYLLIREEWTTENKTLINSGIYKRFIIKTNSDIESKWLDLSVIMQDTAKVLSARIPEVLVDGIERMIAAGYHKRNNPPYFNRNIKYIK